MAMPNNQVAPTHLPSPPQQVIVSSVVLLVVASLVASVASPAAVLQQLLPSDTPAGRTEALTHVASEAALLSAVGTVLWVSLRSSQPRSASLFSYHVDGQWAPPLGVLVLALFPLVDPLLYSTWTSILQATGIPVSAPGAASLVHSVQVAAEQGDWSDLLLHIVASCALGPLWEETFWRGFFVTSLARVAPLPLCVGVSAAGFSALHLSAGNVLPIAVLGAACDVVYFRSGSLGPPLLIHAAWNAYQLLAVAFLHKDAFV